MRVRITRIDSDLPLPEYASSGAAGFDLYCREDMTIEPRTLGFVPANVVIAVPEGHVLIVTLRSGTPRKTGLIVPHGIGVIDSDYRGPEDEIQIQVFNPTDASVTVRRGDRIAQGVIMPIQRVEWDEGKPLTASSRGGFGSTDPEHERT